MTAESTLPLKTIPQFAISLGASAEVLQQLHTDLLALLNRPACSFSRIFALTVSPAWKTFLQKPHGLFLYSF